MSDEEETLIKAVDISNMSVEEAMVWKLGGVADFNCIGVDPEGDLVICDGVSWNECAVIAMADDIDTFIKFIRSQVRKRNA